MKKGQYRGRFAPSPTGALHLGNARTFLIAWLRCRSRGGRMLMRMEDLDHPRVKPETVRQAYDDLRWLGLDWDEPEPGSADAVSSGAYVQSQRLNLYREAFVRLREEGWLYPCFCTRRDIENAQSAPHAGEEMRYPGTCRPRDGSRREGRGGDDQPEGKVPAWRFRVPAEGEGASSETAFDDGFYGSHVSRVVEWSGDFVVGRGEDAPSYQLAVVVDDAAMGITEVVRADDLLLSTHRQLWLYRALGLTPPMFLHVPLVVGPDGRRLAKRHGDTRISEIRRAGASSEAVVGWLASTCGWAEPGEAVAARDLISRFDLTTIPKEPVVVDSVVRKLLGLG